MKRRFPGSPLMALLGVCTVLSGCQGQAADAAIQAGQADGGNAEQRSFHAGDRVPGEYIVVLADAAEPAAVLRGAFQELGLNDIVALDAGRRLYLVRLARDPGPGAVKERAAHSDGIAQVQPNYRYSTQGGSPGPRPPSNDIRLK